MRVLLGKVQPNRLFNTCSFEFSLPDPDPDDDVHPLVLLGLPRPQRGGRRTRAGGGNLGGVGGPGERSTGVGVLVKTIGPPTHELERSLAGSRSDDYSMAFLWFSAPPPARLQTILVCCCCSSWHGMPEPPSLRSKPKEQSFRALPANKTLSLRMGVALLGHTGPYWAILGLTGP